MLSFETIVVAICAVKTSSDNEEVYLELLGALAPYAVWSTEQEAFVASCLALFGLSSLD
jgi:hypothetical protein